ncbi:hypothetical protein BH10BAC2_BH10BAC2_24020 [soil metagenome]
MGQHYNYQHYDITDGLSGLTVYKIVQDKNGFIWFATETGLSRFDGSQFKNFSTADGLPDNEILDLYVDSKNRVWILPFAHAICYYEDGKIHTQSNDTLLSRIKLGAEPVNIIEDEKGDFLILESMAVHVIAANGSTRTYNNIEGSTFSTFGIGLEENGYVSLPVAYGYMHGIVAFMQLRNNGISITRLTDAKKYMLSNKTNIILNKNVEVFRIEDSFKIKLKSEEPEIALSIPEHLIGLSLISDSTFSFNSSDDVFLYNMYRKKFTDTFSLGKIVNCCFRDSEGSYWFATNGYGVYRLTTTAFVNYNLISDDNQLPVYSLSKTNSNLLAGTSQALLWTINLSTKTILKKVVAKDAGESRITGIANKGDQLIIGSGSSDAIKYYDRNTERIVLDGASTKKIFTEGDEVLIATNIGVFKMNFGKPVIKDSMWMDKRSTCAIRLGNTYYIGTLNGLFSVKNHSQPEYLGKSEPLLGSRISAITKNENVLWVATYGNGVMEIKDDKIVKRFTEKDGLSSNMCRDIVFNKSTLWVGTDKGLNSITINGGGFKINKYTSNDGLNSDLINCLLVSNDSVFIGTPYGLVFFKPGNIDTTSIAILNINSIVSAKNKWSGKENTLLLDAGDNRLFIDYSCVSFKSQGNITYHYRLSGLDDKWYITKENTLDYASLSAGDYLLELYAVNAFGKRSNDVKIEFTIAKFFYQKSWFIALVLLILATIGWLLISKTIKNIRKKENQKLITQKRLSELEQMAFRAQMNPHFIFNCLNSIQQYIFSKSIIDANRFITDFSSLIRQTLDLSSKKSITLEAEIKYLNTYLKLEHTRFDEKFDYAVIASPGLATEEIYLPPLLLQPFVENSVRHGVRNLKEKKGIIAINFFVENNCLVCVVEDNGVGRAMALKLKGENAAVYQSKGMSLIQKRIDALNAEEDNKIVMTIEDVYASEKDEGTRITVKLPLE